MYKDCFCCLFMYSKEKCEGCADRSGVVHRNWKAGLRQEAAKRLDLEKNVGEERGNIDKVSMNIVDQLFDAADVPAKKRQKINDKCDAFVKELMFECFKEDFLAQAKLCDEEIEKVRKSKFVEFKEFRHKKPHSGKMKDCPECAKEEYLDVRQGDTQFFQNGTLYRTEDPEGNVLSGIAGDRESAAKAAKEIFGGT